MRVPAQSFFYWRSRKHQPTSLSSSYLFFNYSCKLSSELQIEPKEIKQNRDPLDTGLWSTRSPGASVVCFQTVQFVQTETKLSVFYHAVHVFVYSILNQNRDTYMSGLTGFLFPEYLEYFGRSLTWSCLKFP